MLILIRPYSWVIPSWVPQRPTTIEEPTNGSEEQKSVPSSYLVLPQNLFSELICFLPVLEHEKLSYLGLLFFSHRKYLMKLFRMFSKYGKRLLYYF